MAKAYWIPCHECQKLFWSQNLWYARCPCGALNRINEKDAMVDMPDQQEDADPEASPF
jgi:hypothetical protein